VIVVQAGQSGHPSLVTRNPKSSSIQAPRAQKAGVGLREKCSAKRSVMLVFPRKKLGGHVLGFFQNSRLKLLNSHVVAQPTLFWQTLNASLSGKSG
jgi:hypothetical protein